MFLLKKVLCAFTLIFSLFVGNSVLANEEIKFDYEQEKKEFELYMEEVIEEVEELNRDMSVFNDFTDAEYEKFLPQILKLEAENQDLSEEDLDNLVYEFFVQEKAKKDMMIKPFYISIGGANSQEVALCARHPVRCTKVRSDASTASKQASTYYSSGLHNGNGDAFRHAYWNVLMVKSIGLGPAAEFANAHEYGDTKQPKIEEIMDLHNNHLGRHEFRGYTASQVRNGITSGKGVRIVNNKIVSTNSAGLR